MVTSIGICHVKPHTLRGVVFDETRAEKRWWNVVGPYRLIEWQKCGGKGGRGGSMSMISGISGGWFARRLMDSNVVGVGGGVVSGGVVSGGVVSNLVREKIGGTKGVVG
ncbi:hypothetical protein Tco_0497143 [Tanacetum coccineum]